MIQQKAYMWIIIVLVACLSLLPGQTTVAQVSGFIEVLYPQQGGLGEEVSLLLRGSGFEGLGRLNEVVISGTQARIMGYTILSDEAAEAHILIPKETPVGETEVSFIFGEFSMDALFIVTEGDEHPIVKLFSPHEGQVDNEVILFFEVSDFFLGGLGGVTIEGMEIPVVEYEVNESGEAWAMRVYLPPDTPSGEVQIRLYFEYYSHRDDFIVYGPEEPPAPSVFSYEPTEGRVDTEIEFVLRGHYLNEIGELVGLTIGDMDVPVSYYQIESDEYAVAGAYLPPDLPPGESRIAFYYESYGPYAFTFFVVPREPGGDQNAPRLRSLSPQEGEVDSSIELFLEGENLRSLGELIGVWIGNFLISDLDYDIESNDSVVVYGYLPEDIPAGDQTIVVEFDNAIISDDFFVSESPRIDFPDGIVWVAGGLGAGVLVGGGILVARANRKRRLKREKEDQRERERHSGMELKVDVDFGSQTIEPAGDSLTMDIDIRFEVSSDPGEQDIADDGNGLVEEQ